MSTLTFVESNPLLFRGYESILGHLHDFWQVINCDCAVWVQRNTLPGQSSSTSLWGGKRRAVLKQNHPILPSPTQKWCQQKRVQPHGTWQGTFVPRVPQEWKRDMSGHPGPAGGSPGLTALTQCLWQTQWYVLKGGKWKQSCYTRHWGSRDGAPRESDRSHESWQCSAALG